MPRWGLLAVLQVPLLLAAPQLVPPLISGPLLGLLLLLWWMARDAWSGLAEGASDPASVHLLHRQRTAEGGRDEMHI